MRMLTLWDFWGRFSVAPRSSREREVIGEGGCVFSSFSGLMMAEIVLEVFLA